MELNEKGKKGESLRLGGDGPAVLRGEKGKAGTRTGYRAKGVKKAKGFKG